LHYACAKNNQKLVEYILKKKPELVNFRNKINQTPVQLTNDAIIQSLINSKRTVQSSINLGA